MLVSVGIPAPMLFVLCEFEVLGVMVGEVGALLSGIGSESDKTMHT
jgi:hypothetical protein